MQGVSYTLLKDDVVYIKELCNKFPALSYREILVMYKYVSREKIEAALREVSYFLSVDEYLNKFCNLSPSKIYKELYKGA